MHTFMIVNCSVAVLMQQLLHATQGDGCEVARVLQLEEALQVGGRLTPSHVDTLTV